MRPEHAERLCIPEGAEVTFFERRKVVENFEVKTDIVLSYRISAISFKAAPKRAAAVPAH